MAATDDFSGTPTVAMVVPCTDAIPVTPDDVNDLVKVCRALIIGTAGNLKVDTAAGQTRTLLSVPAGVLPLRVKRVWATGTTAAAITALY